MAEAIDQRAHLAEVATLAGLAVDPEHVLLPRDRYFDANGLRLHFLEWGESTARPIILLHGGALTAHTWDVVCLGLQPDFRCIAPDLRGHGDSAWAADAAILAGVVSGSGRAARRRNNWRRPGREAQWS